jgi:hypothetical protein
MARRFAGRAPAGLLLTAALASVLAVGFDLSSIASLGSAVALVLFALVSVGHLRVRRETGALAWVLFLGVTLNVIVLVTFVFTTLVDEPATAVALVVILAVSIALDLIWKSRGSARLVSD